MSTKVITATNANRGFSELLRQVEDGQTVEITNHGRTVAYVVPPSTIKPNREAAKQRLLDYFRSRPGIEVQPWTRDELYEDDD
jgi:prevent-host-death family protein